MKSNLTYTNLKDKNLCELRRLWRKYASKRDRVMRIRREMEAFGIHLSEQTDLDITKKHEFYSCQIEKIMWAMFCRMNNTEFREHDLPCE